MLIIAEPLKKRKVFLKVAQIQLNSVTNFVSRCIGGAFVVLYGRKTSHTYTVVLALNYVWKVGASEMNTAVALQVKMLGEFSIAGEGGQIDDGGNRSRKVWLLLAYMIYNRRRTIPQEELVGLLWGEEEGSANPLNALKTMFHRVRATLNQLDPGAGHALIIRKGGNYAWNTEVPIVFDVDEFDALCRSAAAAPDETGRLASMLKALSLYQGDFLSRLSSEPWVVPIAAYYHNIYIQAVLDALTLLQEQNRQREAADLCRKALNVEPYNEMLYRHLMQCLMDMQDQKGAVTVYEEMSELLFSNFGVMPADETRAIYREALRTVNERAVPLGMVREQLREQESEPGALFCEYDFFKVLYQAEARAVARSGDAVHVGLLSVNGQGDKELSKRSLDRAMENLREQVRMGLRRGDIVSRCSVSQYILMLPQANYENSCMVCERIIKAFVRQYPHSPARLSYSVQPLEPNL